MDALAKLTAIEELKGLKARYCRAVDTKDAALLRTLFTDDAVLDVRGSATDPVSGVNFAPEATAEAISGLDAIVDMYMLTRQNFYVRSSSLDGRTRCDRRHHRHGCLGINGYLAL